MMLNRYFKYLLIAALCLQMGCFRENNENCFSGLRLRFSYTLNNSARNLFGEKVHAVQVYLFDEGGVLRAVAQDQGAVLTDDYVMHVEIAQGRYTAVVWGGGEEELAASYLLGSGVIVGQTRLADFRMMLRQQTDGNAPHSDAFGDLFYGALGSRTAGTSAYVFEQIEVNSDLLTERTIELIKNTNTLMVTVNGLEYLPHYTPQTDPADVLGFAVAVSNGDCLYDNTICPDARPFVFSPMAQRIGDDSMTADIKLMRLDMTYLAANPMLLSVQNPVTGENYLWQPIDVLNVLKQARSEAGALLYKNQEDFDREDEFHIEIRFEADLYVRVFVENWEIVNLKPEID